MNRIGTWSGLFLCLAAALGSLTAHAQEIRRVAQPNESVRLPHGSYVCDGQTTTSPVDETYDMVTCTGPIYNAGDYAALFTKLNHDELLKLNDLTKLNHDELVNFNANTQAALNRDIRAAIHRQFQGLPANLRQAAAVQNLEKSLSDYVDERLPEGRGGNPSRPSRLSGQAASPAGAPPVSPQDQR
jgi:hypothetical protein